MRADTGFKELSLLEGWLSSLQISGECVLGGSTARGEAVPDSDIDLYAVVSVFDAWRLLSRSRVFQNIFFGKKVSLTVLPRVVLFSGAYYMEGVTKSGEWKSGHCLPEVQARSALRTAYGALAFSALHKESDSWYRMRKAVLYGAIAYGLSEGIIDPHDTPVFSFERAERILLPHAISREPLYASLPGIFIKRILEDSDKVIILHFLSFVAKRVCKLPYPWQLRLIDLVTAIRQRGRYPFFVSDEYSWYVQFGVAILQKKYETLRAFSGRYVPCMNTDV